MEKLEAESIMKDLGKDLAQYLCKSIFYKARTPLVILWCRLVADLCNILGEIRVEGKKPSSDEYYDLIFHEFADSQSRFNTQITLIQKDYPELKGREDLDQVFAIYQSAGRILSVAISTPNSYTKGQYLGAIMGVV